MSFVLASQSPFRLALLNQIGYTPSIVSPQNVDESVLPKELPRAYVRRVMNMKVTEALQKFPGEIILGADTIVAVGRRIFQKPETIEEAEHMLALFSGRRFKVITAVGIAQKERRVEKIVPTTIVFKRLSAFEKAAYLKTNTWHHTSGGIAIEAIGGAFIKAIHGSASSVMGLPLYETKNLLESFGIYPEWMKG